MSSVQRTVTSMGSWRQTASLMRSFNARSRSAVGDKYRTRAVMHDVHRDASERCVRDPGTCMGRHGEQRRGKITGTLDDRSCRVVGIDRQQLNVDVGSKQRERRLELGVWIRSHVKVEWVEDRFEPELGSEVICPLR